MSSPKAPQARGDGASDLSAEAARTIDETFAQLDALDFYALLGVARDAPRAKIRSAFSRAAPPFHPDRYFGKQLGAHGPKMQAIFARMTLAHDTLLDDEARAAYDRDLPAAVSGPVLAASAPSAAPPASGLVPRTSAGPPAASPPPQRPSGSIPAFDMDRARREALAARLGGGRLRSHSSLPAQSPAPRAVTSPGASPVPPKASAASHVEAALAALRKNDLTEAADCYKRALELTSEPSIRAAYEATMTRVRAGQVEAALHQVRLAERTGKWNEAGIAYARLLALRPSAETAHRAACAFRRAGGDPRRALHHAEQAVQLDAEKAAYRVTLALLWLDAGQTAQAKEQLERAQKLDRDEPTLRDAWAKLKSIR
jgi:curved DNA-binding protein CbpA